MSPYLRKVKTSSGAARRTSRILPVAGVLLGAADEYSPDAIAWTGSGFAYLAVNYRGSSGRAAPSPITHAGHPARDTDDLHGSPPGRHSAVG